MRHFRLSFLSLLLLAILACPCILRADVIVAKDTVTGTVIGKNKEPLPGAKVEIIGQPYSAFTDLDGRFNIKCDKGAKKVLVSYPKARDVKKKISPDMTVRIGRTWRQAPENYQWFVGATIGVALTATDLADYDYDYGYGHQQFYSDDGMVGANVSVMVGRVKSVGWYAKGFVALPARGMDYGIEEATSTGAILGGMVRLGCPLHFYLGGGFGYTHLEAWPRWYHHWSWQIDMGFLFRFKDNYGFNLSMNMGTNKTVDILHGSAWNFGLAYFFDN